MLFGTMLSGGVAPVFAEVFAPDTEDLTFDVLADTQYDDGGVDDSGFFFMQGGKFGEEVDENAVLVVMDENGNQVIVDVPYLDYFVHAFVWRVNVGRISLYLLDTDNEMNSEFDRPITHQLYGGDWENRLKQEILLGIGGILTLKKLGIKKDVYHCNEGHAALINVQRICDYVAEGLS